MQQVTKEVAVSKGTFFNYFPAKEHLLREWYRRITFTALDEVRRGSFATAEAAVQAVFAALAVQAAADPDLYAMKERFAFAGGVLSDEERELDGELESFLIEHVARGRDGGELRFDLDTGFFASTLVAVLTGTAHQWVIAEHGFDLVERVAKRTAFLFRAARA